MQPLTAVTTNRVFVDNLIALGFVSSVSYTSKYIINPNLRKIFAVGKSGTFNVIFLVVGFGHGWGVRRFHNNIYMFSNPT